jgi:hypothetical protein
LPFYLLFRVPCHFRYAVIAIIAICHVDDTLFRYSSRPTPRRSAISPLMPLRHAAIYAIRRHACFAIRHYFRFTPFSMISP